MYAVNRATSGAATDNFILTRFAEDRTSVIVWQYSNFYVCGWWLGPLAGAVEVPDGDLRDGQDETASVFLDP